MRRPYFCLAITALAGVTACTHHTTPPAPMAPAHSTVVALPLLPVPSKGPVTSFADGKYQVGDAGNDIAPGEYKTSGPPVVSAPAAASSVDGSDVSTKCYWARLKDFTGAVSSVVAMQYGNHGPDIVVIEPGDKGFETRGCGTWTRVNP